MNNLPKSTLKLPMINEQYSEQFSKDAVVVAKKLKTAYGTYIKEASATIGVPVDIIVGFMIIENDKGDPEATSYSCTAKRKATFDCYVGLMQMGAETAYDTMKAQAVDLDPKEASVIQKYLPGFLKVGGKVSDLKAFKGKIFQALMKPEFSIWIGTLHLAQLMKRTTDSSGNYRLDHVIVKYNRGVGNFVKEVVNTGLKNADTTTLAKKLPVAETRSYIKKFVGIKGTIEMSKQVPL